MNFSGLGEAAKKAAQWASENPGSTAMYGVSGVALLAPALIAGPALAVVGFGATGPVAASLAAGAQASIGNVAAGSLFATLQSAGMAGYGAAVVNGAIQAGGAAAVLATGGTAAMKSKARQASQKLDLIPIEYTWAALKSKMKENLGDSGEATQDSATVTEVENAVDNSWKSITPDTIMALEDSMLQQIEAYTKNEGKTGY